MNGDPPKSNVGQRSVGLLMNWHLLQVIQGLPTIYHPGGKGRGELGHIIEIVRSIYILLELYTSIAGHIVSILPIATI